MRVVRAAGSRHRGEGGTGRLELTTGMLRSWDFNLSVTDD